MKPTNALASLLLAACAGAPPEPRATPPTTPPTPTGSNQVDGGEWSTRAALVEPNSEFALAESNGKLYVLGGYPASRQTVATVQVYDIATDRWTLGPPLRQPNNHGMAVGLNGRIYLIGGQLTADQEGYVSTVYELDPARGEWVEKAPMPTARSGGVAVVHGGKIYVAGGRVPRGATSPSTTRRPTGGRCCRICPPSATTSPARRSTAASTSSAGGSATALSPLKTTAHEVFDPQTRTWTTAAPMLRGRSGINGVVARGCFHVWGGEAPPPTGMTPTTTTTILGPTPGPASVTCPSPSTASAARPSRTA
jgi:hypothetical protein